MNFFTDQDTRLPPVIVVGPKNQTLEAKEVALLPCMGEGQPPPAIRWFKDGKALPYNDPHYMYLPSGTLQISGNYKKKLFHPQP